MNWAGKRVFASSSVGTLAMAKLASDVGGVGVISIHDENRDVLKRIDLIAGQISESAPHSRFSVRPRPVVTRLPSK